MAKTIQKEIISISRSYHDAIEMYGKNFAKLFGVALVPYVLTTILSFALRGSFAVGVTDVANLSTTGIFVSILILFVIALLQIIGFIALIYLTIHHKKATLLTAFEESFGFFVRFTGYAIIFIFLTAVGLTAGYAVVILIGSLLGRFSLELIDSAIGWLYIIPLAVSSALTAFYIFTGFVIVDKNVSLREALKTSFSIVKPQFWAIVTRLILFYIVSGILVFILTRIPTLGNLLSLLIITPFTSVYLSVLYKSLKKE